ncbi:MAG: PspA/IM30 family protein, partial [Planctomycetaceae bacterium]
RMLYQLIVDMEEELEHIRRSVAEAIADEIQTRKRVQRAKQEVEDWTIRAKDAMSRHDETAARSALKQKISAEERSKSMNERYQRQVDETIKLKEAVAELQDRTAQARQKRTLLAARLSRATSTRKINDAMDRVHSKSAFAQFAKLEGRVEREEALAEAYDRLDGRDPEAESLQRDFEARERADKIDREFDELRKQTTN